MADIAKLRSLLAKATPGVWQACGHDRGGCICGLLWSKDADAVICKPVSSADADEEGMPIVGHEFNAANSTLIAAMHEALPALLDIAEAATWIAVSDRPPNATGIFIVYDAICGHARLFDFDAESSQASFMQSHGFTHWMPLPKPPAVVPCTGGGE